MSMLDRFGSTPIVQAVGLAVIHYSWQGLLIGSVLSVVLIRMRDRAPSARYAACLAAMLLMLAAPVLTCWSALSGGGIPLGGAVAGMSVFEIDHGTTSRIAPLLPWIACGWLLGASFLQLRLLQDWIRAQRIKTTRIRPLPAHWQQILDNLRQELGVRNAVRMFQSTLVQVPSVVGWLRPIILIPGGIVTRLTPPRIRGIIAHELAHIRRQDYLVNLVQNVFESLLFFHPITWWVSRRLNVEREYCCDDVAVSVSDCVLHYAQALSFLEEFRGYRSLTTLASTGGSLMNRISRIFEKRSAATPGVGKWLPPVMMLAGIALVAAMAGTGCETDPVEGSAVSNEIAGPDIVVEPEVAAVDPRLQPCIERLEASREAGDLTAGQFEAVVAKLRAFCSDGEAAGCDGKGEGPRCVIVCPPDGAGSLCCPGGALKVRKDESLEDAIRYEIESKVAGRADVHVEELGGDGETGLVFVRVEAIPASD